MQSLIEKTRAAVYTLVQSLDPATIALIETSRGLEAIVDKRFEWQTRAHRWYAVISRGDHIHVVADIDGLRISLQRYVLTLAEPTLTFDDLNQVSFINKVSLDCRVCNLENRVGRQAVMRNRRPKRNTTSQYKGVSKVATTKAKAKWKAQIKGGGNHIYLGYFEEEKWAAMVYDAAAYLLFEGSAHYNLPDLCPNLDALDIAAAQISRHRYKTARKNAAQSVGLGNGT